MKIAQKTVTIKLGDPGDEAVLTFAQLKNDARARIAHLLRAAEAAGGGSEAAEAIHGYQQEVLAACRAVENLFEDGAAITVSQVQRGELYPETVGLLLSAYFAGIAAKPEADEKNLPASPSA